MAAELRYFDKPTPGNPGRAHGAVSLQSEYYKTWNNARDIFAFVPFVRWDEADSQRTHIDIRELTWVHVADNWEFRMGVRKVFWGVTESQHLVDIINQTDLVENFDGEEKLGQPMLNLSLVRDWGILELYLLTGFRERRYPGPRGRPGFPLQIDEDMAIFDSSAGIHRLDFAARWSQYFGDLELGLAHFSGTSREPRLDLNLNPATATPSDASAVPAMFTPVYAVIDQSSLDAQYFVGDWAWKLEAITRSGFGDRYTAATLGFEKTFVGLFGSRGDLGVVAEYLYDSRGSDATVIGEDDIALGLRYTLNNVADTTLLLLWLYDLDSREYLTTLEASSRIGARWKLVVEASVFSHGRHYGTGLPAVLASLGDRESELGLLQDEDFVKMELIRYF